MNSTYKEGVRAVLVTGVTLEQLAKRPKQPPNAKSLPKAKAGVKGGTKEKSAKRTKPLPDTGYYARSTLQSANTQVQWVSNFMLHHVGTQFLRDVELSEQSVKLLGMHKQATDRLKASLRKDYLAQRTRAKEAK